jgi:hypothetical protein
MKIPAQESKSKGSPDKRLDFFVDLIEKCRVSRVERMQEYSSRRLFWLYGTDGSYENEDTDLGLGPPPGNKIWPHIDQLTSFLYSQDTTRFSTKLGAAVPKQFQTWIPKLNQVVNDEWHNSNTDIIYGIGLALALVYGCTFLKPLWKKNGIQPHIVLPHNMGFLREDVGILSRQEVFCQWYTITESQFRTDYGPVVTGDIEKIIRKLSARSGDMPIEAQEAGLDRIIMSAQDPLGTGGQPGSGVAVVDWLASVANNYVPRVREPLIEMCELYVWDDELRDFRIVTLADPQITVIDRPLEKTGWLRHQYPFIHICPNPDLGYIYGISEVERLIPLQTQRNRCEAQLEHLADLQAHAPMTSSGFPSDLLEIQNVLDSPFGVLNNPDGISQGGQAPKADRVRIEIPKELYERLDRIDAKFEEMSGLPPVTRGMNPPGVRAGGHASELAKLGSSRARKRAMIVEDGLEAAATLYLKMIQKYCGELLEAPIQPGQEKPTEKFVAEQFTDDFTVEVDAHSNSPIFVDDQTALAFQLFKAKAITREGLLRRVPVSGRDQLIAELHDIIEPQEAKAAQAAQQAEAAKAGAGGRRRRPNGGQPGATQ